MNSAKATHEAPTPRRKSGLTLWKKLLFAVLTTLAALAAVELGLRILGVQPAVDQADPFVGFASYLPLFVEQETADGTREMVTAENKLSLFNHQRFPRAKGQSTYRIFCLGGSTTYGRPYDDQTAFARWLREYLPAADPTRDWEVINAGGISYASYRVASLMEELVQYEPDLFIIYSGHNEFLEQRTYREMLATPSWIHNLNARLAHLRTYAVVRQAMGRESNALPRERAEQDLLPAEVDAILDRSMGPESYYRDDEFARRVLEHYRFSLTRMIQIARGARAEVVLVTCASNLRDFEPFKSEHREDLTPEDRDLWLGLVHQSGLAFEQGDFPEALRALDEAAEIDDRHARLHFLRGRILLRLERFDQARAAFVRARDEDVCPLRALSPMQAIVLDVAAQQQVPAVDYVAFLDDQVRPDTPGDDWFLDHVHPTIEGHRRLALELIAALHDRQLVSFAESWNGDAIDEVTRRVMDGLNSRDHANALRNLAKVLRWAGKTEEAGALALRAVKGLADDREAHFLAGEAWRRKQNPDAAIAEYLQALQIDPDFTVALVRLGATLLENGDPQAALNYLRRAAQQDPERADTQLLLGKALASLGDAPAAEAAFRKHLQLAPDSAEARRGLAALAAKDKRWDAAVDLLEEALDFEPQNPDAHYDLGCVFMSLNRTRDASDELLLCLLLDPEHQAAREMLDRLPPPDAAETTPEP